MAAQFEIPFFNGISTRDRLFFTKHLATMIKAGIPLAEGIATIRDQTRSKTFHKVLSQIYDDLLNGQSFADALKKHKNIFDELYTSLIEVSEESGTLDTNLEFLAIQLSKDYNLQKKIQSALLYPMVVFLATSIMGGFIAIFILPQLVSFFDAFEIELPLTTQILIFIAKVMKSYGVIIIGGLIALFIIGSLIVKTKKVKPFWDAFILKTPMIGSLIAYGQLARFARNLGMIKSGVPVLTSIETTARTLNNLKFKNDLLEVAATLKKGKEIGTTLEKQGFSEYPPLVSKMISVGEKSGKLDEALLYLGDFYEDEIDDLSKNLTTVLEPILLVVIGLIVGFVALAIISPIYELTGSIRK